VKYENPDLAMLDVTPNTHSGTAVADSFGDARLERAAKTAPLQSTQ
jgi:hypothetical protein